MIPKAKVSIIGIHRAGGRVVSVAGYEKKPGYHPAHRKRVFKSYDRALRYSIELRDYYQVPVIDF